MLGTMLGTRKSEAYLDTEMLSGTGVATRNEQRAAHRDIGEVALKMPNSC
jgi:hypothetical protein